MYAYNENGVKVKVNNFAEATELCARSYIAGIDSAIRHSMKGDADSYLDKKCGTRSRSWNIGYEFAMRCVARHGIPSGYSKDALGTTQRDADLALLHMMRGDSQADAPQADEPDEVVAVEAVEPPKQTAPQPVEVTSACAWYAVEVEGSKQAGKGKHAGMWYVKVA